MDRRAFISGVTLGLLAAPLAAGAQQPAGKVWRIGILSPVPLTTLEAPSGPSLSMACDCGAAIVHRVPPAGHDR